MIFLLIIKGIILGRLNTKAKKRFVEDGAFAKGSFSGTFSSADTLQFFLEAKDSLSFEVEVLL